MSVVKMLLSNLEEYSPPSAGLEKIETLEETLHIKLPDQLKQILLKTDQANFANGPRIHYRSPHFTRSTEYHGFWRVYGTGSHNTEAIMPLKDFVEDGLGRESGDIPLGYFVFGDDTCGGFWVIDLKRTGDGSIWFFELETVDDVLFDFSQGYQGMCFVAPSFEEAMGQLDWEVDF